jgi:ubiquinone/menaquinone biosynthesis C-methylase UbiE
MIKLSLLILTMPDRVSGKFLKLLESLDRQILGRDDVEIVALYDNVKMTIGEKRQALLTLAHGEYIAFIDDDDRIAHDYIYWIMNELCFYPNIDCVTFDSQITTVPDEPPVHIVKFSKEYPVWTPCDTFELHRKPCHVHPCKASIAKKYNFPNLSIGEDFDWLARVYDEVQTVSNINRVLYYYDNYRETKIEPKHVLPSQSGYHIMIPTCDISMATDCFTSMWPNNITIVNGIGAESFAQLVNKCIAECPTEIVIICNDRIRPALQDINKMLELIEQGYGLVGLYRFGFFGFKKDLIRRIGGLEERCNRWFEDDDMIYKLVEANIAYYEEESCVYVDHPSRWVVKDEDYAESKRFFYDKWHIINPNSSVNTDANFRGGAFIYYFNREYGVYLKRLIPEQEFNYNLGPDTNSVFLPWSSSYLLPRRGEMLALKKYTEKPDIKSYWSNFHKEQNADALTGTSYAEIVRYHELTDKIYPGVTVLNIGVGKGYCTKGFYDNGCRVSVLDICEEALQTVRPYIERGYLQDNIDQLPANYFDIVISNLVAQHMADIDLRKQLTYVIRSLKDTGFFSIQLAGSLILEENNNPNYIVGDGISGEVSMLGGRMVRTPEYFAEMVKQCGGICTYTSEKIVCVEYQSYWYRCIIKRA